MFYLLSDETPHETSAPSPLRPMAAEHTWKMRHSSHTSSRCQPATDTRLSMLYQKETACFRLLYCGYLHHLIYPQHVVRKEVISHYRRLVVLQTSASSLSCFV